MIINWDIIHQNLHQNITHKQIIGLSDWFDRNLASSSAYPLCFGVMGQYRFSMSRFNIGLMQIKIQSFHFDDGVPSLNQNLAFDNQDKILESPNSPNPPLSHHPKLLSNIRWSNQNPTLKVNTTRLPLNPNHSHDG